MAPREFNAVAPSPFHIMTKPIGPKCNIDCTYCFYLEKEALFAPGEHYRMREDVLEHYIKNYIATQPTSEVTFAWQGGEPTLLGVPFFRKVVELQKKYGAGRRIENAFQTNATLVDDEWGEFFHDNQFLVGVSIDGPEKIHNALRVDRQGRGTWEQVMRGVRVLQRHHCDFNTLTCVNRITSQHPVEIYKFLKGIGSRFLQFIPIVERLPDAAAHKLGLSLGVPKQPDAFRDDGEDDVTDVTPWSVKPADYGHFMNAIFDRWVAEDVGKIFVQIFDVMLGKWLNVPGGLCIFSETCGRALALEHDGSLYSCDHFVYPEFKLGNINDSPLKELVFSDQQNKFGNDKRDALPKFCRECEFLRVCNGGCPKQRFRTTPDGEPGLHYLCRGYKMFYSHIAPHMEAMAALYQQNRPASDIMRMHIRPGR